MPVPLHSEHVWTRLPVPLQKPQFLSLASLQFEQGVMTFYRRIVVALWWLVKTWTVGNDKKLALMSADPTISRACAAAVRLACSLLKTQNLEEIVRSRRESGRRCTRLKNTATLSRADEYLHACCHRTLVALRTSERRLTDQETRCSYLMYLCQPCVCGSSVG